MKIHRIVINSQNNEMAVGSLAFVAMEVTADSLKAPDTVSDNCNQLLYRLQQILLTTSLHAFQAFSWIAG